MQKNVNALTEAEKVKLANIRNALPKPDANTLMQKVIPKDDIIKYIESNDQWYKEVGGYVSRATDTKHLKSFEDLYFGERLDYSGTKFFVEDGSCGVLRFKNSASNEAVIPSGELYNGYEYPFTSTGFTSGKMGRIGIPEWHLRRRLELKDGDELWEIFNDGTEKLKAIYNLKDKKFIPTN
jgi:hypothetical protein